MNSVIYVRLKRKVGFTKHLKKCLNWFSVFLRQDQNLVIQMITNMADILVRNTTALHLLKNLIP